MATGLQLPLRRALLTTLKADAGLTAAVPVASIQPVGEPVWPFVWLTSPRTSRLRAAGVNGAIVRFDAHAFAKTRDVETAQDHAGRIGGLIEAALSDRWLTLEGGYRAHVEIGDSQLLEDGSPDAYHWFGQINCRVLAA